MNRRPPAPHAGALAGLRHAPMDPDIIAQRRRGDKHQRRFPCSSVPTSIHHESFRCDSARARWRHFYPSVVVSKRAPALASQSQRHEQDSAGSFAIAGPGATACGSSMPNGHSSNRWNGLCPGATGGSAGRLEMAALRSAATAQALRAGLHATEGSQYNSDTDELPSIVRVRDFVVNRRSRRGNRGALWVDLLARR